MSVSLATYTSRALVTNQREYEPLWSRLGYSGEVNPRAVDLIHGAIGVVTEVGELCDGLKKSVFYGRTDKVNIVEEVGDCFWYIAIMAHAGGTTVEALVDAAYQMKLVLPKNRVTLHAKLAGFAAALLMFAAMEEYGTMVKHSPQVMWDRMFRTTVQIVAFLVGILEAEGCSLDVCLDTNITKLMKRYATRGHFTADDANQRNLDAERAILERGISG